ncbi:hypothetical protein [Roseibacillus ishigakijimensis]|uniref:Uncharacterized protein n=1 Tax=Roseibacillus ishigakijimensis TaxID=454146 RepID=A0A934RK67_9BACT|nr:hypothetical protein [Roseibacillus ishigakijimensis]MBK1833212.1 hypothetical protein [Roseibacillus ishigakijimensis]
MAELTGRGEGLIEWDEELVPEDFAELWVEVPRIENSDRGFWAVGFGDCAVDFDVSGPTGDHTKGFHYFSAQFAPEASGTEEDRRGFRYIG